MRKSSWLISVLIIVNIFLLMLAAASISRMKFYFSNLDYFGRYGITETIHHIGEITGFVAIVFTGGMLYAILRLRRRGE